MLIRIFLSLVALIPISSILEAQVYYYDIKDDEDISIVSLEPQKHTIYIFIKVPSKSLKTAKLLSDLELLEMINLIELDEFNIHVVKIHSDEYRCANKCLNLEHVELPSHFVLEPYHILLFPGKTNSLSIKCRDLLESFTQFEIYSGIDGKSTEIFYIPNHNHLVKLIKRDIQCELYDLRREVIKQQMIIQELNAKLDSILNSNNKKR